MSLGWQTLLQYHESHFRGQPLPPLSDPGLWSTSNDALNGLSSGPPVDDALGNYGDGVERTLTDEQVAIFRHTEIQGLLRERKEKTESVAANQQIRDGEIDHAPIPRSKYQPSMSAIVHEKESSEGKKDHRPYDNNAEITDRQNPISAHLLMHLDYTEDRIGDKVLAEQPASSKDNVCIGKIITSEEEGNIAPPMQRTASPSSGEAVTRTPFVWPELHD